MTELTGITGLTDTQKAYALETGEKIIVEVTLDGAHGDGSSNTVLAFVVAAWQIDDAGVPVTPAVSLPQKTYSVLTSAIAEGRIDLTVIEANMYTDAGTRMANWLPIATRLNARS